MYREYHLINKKYKDQKQLASPGQEKLIIGMDNKNVSWQVLTRDRYFYSYTNSFYCELEEFNVTGLDRGCQIYSFKNLFLYDIYNFNHYLNRSPINLGNFMRHLHIVKLATMILPEHCSFGGLRLEKPYRHPHLSL
uniref:Uncharacterized protein n=1 Tax=Solanum lycopersicum TaxID=4081 RepID=A0A3Q7FP06_SOLLC